MVPTISTSATFAEQPGHAVEPLPPNLGFAALIDGLLRRREAFFEEIFRGQRVGELLRGFLLAIVVLTACYGITMGAAGMTTSFSKALLQMASSAVKVPILYLLSIVVCFPVLYVTLVLMGARLRFTQTLALIFLAVTLNAVLLASCSPIIIF